MKILHCPDLEPCKKLTEIGFPNTEYWWHTDRRRKYTIDKYRVSSWEEYVCPSVMELLDALRGDRRNLALRRYTEQEDCERMGKKPKSLPDYLAEFVIFDVENNYISF